MSEKKLVPVSDSDIDKYEDIKELRKDVPAKKGSMGEMIESFQNDRTRGYSAAEKEGFTHTNKARSFDDEGSTLEEVKKMLKPSSKKDFMVKSGMRMLKDK